MAIKRKTMNILITIRKTQHIQLKTEQHNTQTKTVIDIKVLEKGTRPVYMLVQTRCMV